MSGFRCTWCGRFFEGIPLYMRDVYLDIMEQEGLFCSPECLERYHAERGAE